MNNLTVRQRTSYLSVYILSGAFLISLLGALPIEDAVPMKWLIPSIFVSLILLSLWVKSVQSQRQVEFLPSEQRVVVHTVSPLFRPRKSLYDLNQFGSVISYVAPARFSVNRVELVTSTGGEALLIAWFDPANGARSFLALPTEAESPEAARLRGEIARQTGLLDGGYLGARLPGAQISG